MERELPRMAAEAAFGLNTARATEKSLERTVVAVLARVIVEVGDDG
jgi:hypothetical protein